MYKPGSLLFCGILLAQIVSCPAVQVLAFFMANLPLFISPVIIQRLCLIAFAREAAQLFSRLGEGRDLVRQIEEQVAAINQTSSAIEEMSASIHSMTEIAEEKNASARKLQEEARENYKKMQMTNSIIAAINGKMAFDKALMVDCDHCDLGIWLNEGGRQLLDESTMGLKTESHEEFHELIGRIRRGMDRAPGEELHGIYRRVIELSSRILELLRANRGRIVAGGEGKALPLPA